MKFQGVLVAPSDELACGVKGPLGYFCTRFAHLEGPHVAHTFHETGPRAGRPDAEVDRWFPSPVSSPLAPEAPSWT